MQENMKSYSKIRNYLVREVGIFLNLDILIARKTIHKELGKYIRIEQIDVQVLVHYQLTYFFKEV